MCKSDALALYAKLNGVDQSRINEHASLTIETNVEQETAMLNAIKGFQNSLPNWHLGIKEAVWDGTESTCTSRSIEILTTGKLDFGDIGTRSPKNLWEAAFRKFGVGEKYELVGTSTGLFGTAKGGSYRFITPTPGVEYGKDPRGQSRKVDRKAINNDKNLLFRDGKLKKVEPKKIE